MFVRRIGFVDRIYTCLMAAVVVAGCSSGGTPVPTATCSAGVPCPDGLLCVLAKGLCALPAGDDLAMASADLQGPQVDMAGPADMPGGPADMPRMPTDMPVGIFDLLPPADMTLPSVGDPRSCPGPHLCWENTRPQPRSLQGVWGTGASDIWTVGAYGVILHFDGTVWTTFQTDTVKTLRAVWGRSAHEVWMLGDAGAIFFWDGTRLVTQASPVTADLYGVWGDATTVWAVGTGGTLLKWNGTAWSQVPLGITTGLTAIWGSGSSDVWAVGTGGAACHFGGTSWTCSSEFGGGDAATVTGTSSSDVWVMGLVGGAWHWDGSTWKMTPLPMSGGFDILSAVAFGRSDVWAVGTDSAYWHFNGSSWSATLFDGSYFFGLWGPRSGDLYAVGRQGSILHGFGTTWTHLDNGFSGTLSALWGSSDHDVWAFTTDYGAHHFDGSTWQTTMLPGGAGYSATGTGPRDVWVGSTAGRVFHYDGSTWTTITTHDTAAKIVGIYIAASDRVVLAGTTSVQLWDGARYTTAITLTDPATATWGSGKDDAWVATTAGCSVYHWDGVKWSLLPLGCTTGYITGISGTSKSDVYFTNGALSTVYHWDGSTFSGLTTLPGSFGNTAVAATSTGVFVTTSDNQLLTNRGGTWSSAGKNDFPLTSLTGLGGDKVWVGSPSGYVLSYKP